jgi:hypothetical protein
MDALDALRLMVREYPGGMNVVADRLGKAPSTLEKELRGAIGYKLSANDAGAITTMCYEVRSPHAAAYATAVAACCGAHVSLRPPEGQPGAVDLMQDVGRVLGEVSDVVSTVTAAGADGRISLNESRSIGNEVRDAITALQRLEADIAAQHEAGKPAFLRRVSAP